MYVTECPAHDIATCHNPSCSRPGEFTCLDCDDGSCLTCRTCFVLRHAVLPLHRVRRWTGWHFEKESLANMGHIIHLNHDGHECPHEKSGSGEQNLTVMDTNGLHNVRIGWCRCASAPQHVNQLLSVEMVPATVVRPETAFTFRVLRLFHMLTSVARVTPWEFCGTMMRLTENVKIEATRVCLFLPLLHPAVLILAGCVPPI